jgi:nucleoside-diphosphate-sugar epimerase
MSARPPRLFCFGLGYSASVFARRLRADGWTVAGTVRSDETRAALEADGIAVHRFDRDHPLGAEVLAGTTHLLSSVPPDKDGDPVLDAIGPAIAELAPSLAWAGYLSTTGVYGDTGGQAVDETAPCHPTQERSKRRLAAERAWLAVAGLPIHIFRLAGIYGPGSSALDKVRAGRTRRIAKPGHRFGRIHVDDIATVLQASIARPDPGAIYNVTDDAAAEPADVTAFACELLGVPVEDAVPFDEAEQDMTPMQRTFWADNRVIDNTRIHEELGVRLAYPTYREGLSAVLAAERN